MADYMHELVTELNAKAWASTRYRTPTGRTPAKREDHVCSRAAKAIERLTAAPEGHITTAMVREIFTRRLDLSYRQRAYSWHEIQDALEEITARGRTAP